jgi:transposase-like protein
MRKHRSYPVEFKRQVAQEFLAGETLHGLAKRHEINRNLVHIWVAKYEAGSFDAHRRAGIRLVERRAAVFLVAGEGLERRTRTSLGNAFGGRKRGHEADK